MIPPETKAILESGSHSVFSVNPLHQDKIQKASLDAAIREAKSALLRKRPVHIIVVKA